MSGVGATDSLSALKIGGKLLSQGADGTGVEDKLRHDAGVLCWVITLGQRRQLADGKYTSIWVP